jgi:hypothetical protein
MKTWIKRTLLGVAALVVVAVGAVFALATLGDRKLDRQIDVAVDAVPLVSDSASIERGGYLFRSRGCAVHSRDGSGGVVSRTARAADPRPTSPPAASAPSPTPVDGCAHPPRRAPGFQTAALIMPSEVQPLHRCRPRGGRLLVRQLASRPARRHDPPSAPPRVLWRGGVQGRVGEDRPSPAAGAAIAA